MDLAMVRHSKLLQLLSPDTDHGDGVRFGVREGDEWGHSV